MERDWEMGGELLWCGCGSEGQHLGGSMCLSLEDLGITFLVYLGVCLRCCVRRVMADCGWCAA